MGGRAKRFPIQPARGNRQRDLRQADCYADRSPRIIRKGCWDTALAITRRTRRIYRPGNSDTSSWGQSVSRCAGDVAQRCRGQPGCSLEWTDRPTRATMGLNSEIAPYPFVHWRSAVQPLDMWRLPTFANSEPVEPRFIYRIEDRTAKWFVTRSAALEPARSARTFVCT